MNSGGSVTHWIAQLKVDEEAALDKLWKRYWPRLVQLARKKLRGARGPVADEEDVAQEAFVSFYQRFKSGGLPRLNNRVELIALLVVITCRKAASQIEHDMRQKRGGGKLLSESALDILASGGRLGRGIEQVQDNQPSPPELAILKEEYSRYLTGLPDDLRPIAELYLAGYSNDEIAQTIGCVKRTVKRKMPIIFDHWQAMAEDSVSREEGPHK